MTERRIVIMARDAGAGAALAPVTRALIADGRFGVSIVAAGKASAVFERHGLPVLSFPERPEPAQVTALLVREGARLVLTGTSFRPERDAAFWDAAATLGIPSLAVIDHWSNYAERFTVERPFDALPDVIAVMDELTAGRLRDLGCPGDRIRVTGQPYFDEHVQEGTRIGRNEARRELGVDLEQKLVVFASEPQARFFGASPADPNYLGYTEHDSLAVVRAALAEIEPTGMLIVKLHPLEEVDAFHDMSGGQNPTIRVIRAYPATHLIIAADVVVGMTSVFLLEAALLGIPTISIRPGGRPQEFFLDVHRDLIEAIIDAKRAAPAIQRGLEVCSSSRQRPHPRFGDQAVKRLATVIYELAATTPPVLVKVE